MDETVASLIAVIGDLQDAELAGLSSVELTGLLRQAETASRRLDAGIRRVVAEIDRRGVAGEYGACSTGDLVRQKLLITTHEASVRVRQARELTPRVALTGEMLPPLFAHVAGALDCGSITLAHARIITTTRSGLPGEVDARHGDAAEQFLVEQASQLTPTQLGHVATRLGDTLNPDGKFTDEADQERRRSFTLTVHTDGSSTPSGRFTPEVTSLIRPVLDSLSAPQPSEGLPDTRTPPQRRHDGVGEAAMMLLRTGELPDSGGTPVSVLVTVTADHLKAAEQGEDVVVTDRYGTPISLHTITQLGAELELTAVTLDTSGGILSYGRTKRLATCHQRRALAARDKGCNFPGCTRHAAWTEVHHITEWLHGGQTDLNNLVLLCRYHHRNFQKAGWTVRMRNDTEVPEWIPPTWLDEHQRPRRNTVFDEPLIPQFE
jgi:Domain of unknown function (DUF222)/HNH endonuclease